MILADFYQGLSPADVPLYPVAEASHYLHLPAATVSSWLKPRSRRRVHGSTIVPPLVSIADRGGSRLSFNNLVELHVLSTIRQVHNLKMSKVRAGLDYLRELFETDRPLLHVQMQTDGQALFVDRDGGLIDASARGQGAMPEVLDQYLERIERDATGRPSRLFPFVAGENRIGSPKSITIDPRVRFGRPCIVGTNLPTSVIAGRHQAGDSVDELAEDYGRTSCEIEEAIRYERRSAA